jgi:hypothetical protein
MRNTLAECRRCWCPRRCRDRGAGPLHAGGTEWDPDRGQRRAAADRVSHRKPRLTRAGGAGPRRLQQLTATLLNRETMSGTRKQHS